VTGLRPTSAYSLSFFETFADTIPPDITAIEVGATARLAPPAEFPRLLDVGCGVGRVTRGLAASGFDVTGIDASVDALRQARGVTSGGRFVALDYRHVGHMRWTFDVVTSYWNSIGFGSRDEDALVLRAIRQVLRPAGRLLIELYHPEWLEAHQLRGVADPRGATVDRWLEDGRSCHTFRYADGSIDDIRFNVYRPDEMARVLTDAGFRVEERLVWWKTEQQPGPDQPRYQLVAVRT
jgi:SAM-dependent methyltransferase